MSRDRSRLLGFCLRLLRVLMLAGAAAFGPGIPPPPPPAPPPIELREARGPMLKKR